MLADYELAQQPFRVETQLRGARSVLVLTGQMGLEAAGQLRDEAEHLASTGRGVDLDWREAETVTAGCLQVLLALGVSLSEQGQTLLVAGDNPNVRKSLELAGLSVQFPVTEPLV